MQCFASGNQRIYLRRQIENSSRRVVGMGASAAGNRTTVSPHVGALERWKEIKKLWNSQDNTIDQMAGKIQHTDVFWIKSIHWNSNGLKRTSRCFFD